MSAERLKWGLIGGGDGSQIGPVHRMAANMDGLYDLTAGALDHDSEKGRAFAAGLGIEKTRAYGDWREMLAAETARPDGERVDLVTIATPNATHFEITSAFLEAGFNVLCEKPMTTTIADAEKLVTLSERTGAVLAVNYAYTGYPLVRQMRAMVRDGELGAIRLVKAEFAHGHHADASDADNPRIRWRYDPAEAGISAQFADCGIHALHMASFITGQEAQSLSADLVSCVTGRALEDDAMVNLRFDGGAVGRLWTSSVATGRQHGLGIQVFGEKAGLRWAQEDPDRLYLTPTGGGRTTIIERGDNALAPEAASRIAIGHAEGMIEAFATIYRDLAHAISAKRQGGGDTDSLYPNAVNGLRSVAAIHAVVESAQNDGKWVDARPASMR